MLPKERKKLNLIRKWLIVSIFINFILISMMINRYNDIKYIEIDHYIEMRDYIEESNLNNIEVKNLKKEIKTLKDSIRNEELRKIELKNLKISKQKSQKIVKDTITQIQIQTDSL
jgi:hypothetical protein